jgi:ligand-binding sensor domain-containing protein
MRNFKPSKKKIENRKFFFIFRFLFLIFLFPFSIPTDPNSDFHFPFEVSSAGLGDWTTYTNMNYVNEVLLKDKELWCVTTGGVAVLNTNDGTFTKLTNVEGLGGNNLYSITCDSTGSFWFGAQNGTLTKYKPIENSFKVYNFLDRDGSRLRINDIVPDGEQLWIATNIGVSLFLIYKHDGEIKETYRHLGEHLQVDYEVNSIHLVDEKIWVGTIGGVATANKNDPNLLDFSRWISFTKQSSPGLGSDSILSITDMNGDIIVGTAKGVFKLNSLDSTWQVLGLEDRVISDLKYSNQKLFAATNAGIYVYEDYSWKPLPDSGLLTSNFNSLTIDDKGTLWGGTAGKGVSAYDGSGWGNYLIEGPPANVFVDMETDNDGNLWCAQDMYGASLFDGAKWVSLSSIPQMDGHWMRAVEKDNQTNIWFSRWGGGVIRYGQDSTWIRYTEKNSPLKDVTGVPGYVVVNDVAVDEMGNRWFPNWDALDNSTRVVCSPAQKETAWVVYYDQDGLRFPYMQKISAQDGHLYIGLWGSGLLDYNYNWTPENKNDDLVTHYTAVDHHLSDDMVWCAKVDKDGILWVGTSSGLDKFDPDFERFRAVKLPNPLGPQVNDIVVDERNNKWIATSNGLGMMDNQSEFVRVFTTFNSKICDDNVRRLKIDPKTGDVWIGTEDGLSRFESGIGAPAKKLSEVVAFPNPFIIQTGSEMLTFDRLPYQAKVRIFTVAGELVKEIKSGNQWNGRNKAGELVASGIYLFHIQDSSGKSAVGKIAVIRE